MVSSYQCKQVTFIKTRLHKMFKQPRLVCTLHCSLYEQFHEDVLRPKIRVRAGYLWASEASSLLRDSETIFICEYVTMIPTNRLDRFKNKVIYTLLFAKSWSRLVYKQTRVDHRFIIV